MILIDDLGFADLSFNYHLHHQQHQQQPQNGVKMAPILTENIDNLAYSGLMFKNYYVHSHCAPSRASLMTGRYHIRLGDPFPAPFFYGNGSLNRKFKTLADELVQRDYASFHVGKWGIDGSNKAGFMPGYGPTERGFEHAFFVFASGHHHYTKQTGRASNIDLHRWFHVGNNSNYSNFPDVNNEVDVHSTDMFAREAMNYIADHADQHRDDEKPFFLQLSFTAVHDPLLAPEHLIQHPICQNLHTWRRRVYCAMVLGVDIQIGNIVKKLKELNIFDNTLIFISSDNGGHFLVGANNSPLRGAKATPFEGGVRSAGVLHCPQLFGTKGAIVEGLIHIVDIPITLLSIVDKHLASRHAIQVPPSLLDLEKVDGIDQSVALLEFNKNNSLKFSRSSNVKTGTGENQVFTFPVISLENRKELFVGASILSNSTSYIIWPYKLMLGRIGDGRLVDEPKSEWNVDNPTLLDMIEQYVVDAFAHVNVNLFPLEWAFRFLSEHLRDYTESHEYKQGVVHVPFFFPVHQFNTESGDAIPFPGFYKDESRGVFLFNLEDDPTESNNIAKFHPDVVDKIVKRMNDVLSDSEPQETAIHVFFSRMMFVECSILTFLLTLISFCAFRFCCCSSSRPSNKISSR